MFVPGPSARPEPSRPGRNRRRVMPAWAAALAAWLLASSVAAAQTPATPAASPAATPVAAPSPPVWTEIGIDGQISARALADASCPEIAIDGRTQPMDVRADATLDFPGVVCEATVPAEATSAAIGGQPLALLPETLARIAVIGDTGCRVWTDRYQDCDDPAAWPLARVAAQVAAWDPDLIIHVGDYIYREAPCPADAGCAGTPYGDNAATWQADVFAPLAGLLPTTPWLFLRGNHESCDRAGDGWFRYLDPGPAPAACERFTDPYPLTLPGNIRAVVMDTAEIGDTWTTSELNDAYLPQLQQVGALSNSGTWLLTHKPLAGAILDLGGGEQYVSYATIRAIANNVLPRGIDLALGGHIHLGQALLFDPESGAPVQLVVGNSGTMLDAGETAAYAGAILGQPDLALGFVDAGFGYTRLELEDDRLRVTAVALDGGTAYSLVLPRTP